MRPVERGLLLEEEKILAIADLHLGYEFELFHDAGLRIPPQAGPMKDRLGSLIDELQPRELIIVGDYKHNIPFVGEWEYEELEQFARDIGMPITIIKGNHDVGLESIVHAQNVAFGRVRGERRGSVGFFHGHTWPGPELLNCRYLVMGHTHPAILLRDSLGVQTRLACFVESRLEWKAFLERYPSEVPEYNRGLKVIILPSFNRLFGGTGLNVETPLGPLARSCLKIPDSTVILEDGTIIGKIRDLPDYDDEGEKGKGRR
jgi:putative SbcD/Mre11-related phosphoesterase